MDGSGALARRQVTITVGELREHLRRMNDDTKIVLETADGKRLNIRRVSNPKEDDVPFVVITGADDYTPTALGF